MFYCQQNQDYVNNINYQNQMHVHENYVNNVNYQNQMQTHENYLNNVNYQNQQIQINNLNYQNQLKVNNVNYVNYENQQRLNSIYYEYNSSLENLKLLIYNNNEELKINYYIKIKQIILDILKINNNKFRSIKMSNIKYLINVLDNKIYFIDTNNFLKLIDKCKL